MIELNDKGGLAFIWNQQQLATMLRNSFLKINNPVAYHSRDVIFAVYHQFFNQLRRMHFHLAPRLFNT